MHRRDLKIGLSIFWGYLLLFSITFFPSPIWAEMSSTNYQINPDSINFMGIGDASSTNYQLGDTGGEVATGVSTSTNYKNEAGFWHMSMDYHISISSPGDVVMGAITGHGQSALTTNSATWNIDTDNPAGYSLTWKASAATMTSGSDNIAAYTPTIGSTPEIWSVASTDSEWGGHLGKDSTTVNTTTWGVADTYAGGKWLNVSTSDFQIASRTSRTSAAGDDEIIFFGAEIGNDKFQPSGTYTVNVTITATTL